MFLSVGRAQRTRRIIYSNFICRNPRHFHRVMTIFLRFLPSKKLILGVVGNPPRGVISNQKFTTSFFNPGFQRRFYCPDSYKEFVEYFLQSLYVRIHGIFIVCELYFYKFYPPKNSFWGSWVTPHEG